MIKDYNVIFKVLIFFVRKQKKWRGMRNRVLTIKLVRVHVRLLHVCIVFLRTSLVSSSSKVDERGQRGCIIYGAVCQDIGDAEGLFVDFMTHEIAETFS